MGAFLKNITPNYAWILGRTVSPGEQLDLQEIFKGFCEPKVSSRDDVKKLETAKREKKPVTMPSQFAEDEFDLFVDWIENELAVDRGIWEIDRQNSSSAKLPSSRSKAIEGAQSKPAVAQGRRGQQSQQVLAVKDIKRKVPNQKEVTPRDIAWMPYNDETKKFIGDMSADNIRDLKAAFKLVRNLSGQERTRKLIEDRINELATEGIA